MPVLRVHLLCLQAACYVAAGHSALSAQCNSNSALRPPSSRDQYSVPRTPVSVYSVYTRTLRSDTADYFYRVVIIIITMHSSVISRSDIRSPCPRCAHQKRYFSHRYVRSYAVSAKDGALCQRSKMSLGCRWLISRRAHAVALALSPRYSTRSSLAKRAPRQPIHKQTNKLHKQGRRSRSV